MTARFPKIAAPVLALSLLAGCPEEPTPADDAAVHPSDGGDHADAGVALDSGVADASVTDDAPTPPSDGAVLPHECSVTMDASISGHVTRLCDIAGPVRHFTIAGVAVPAGHEYAQIIFGVDEASALKQTGFEDSEVRVTLYGGGPPPPALLFVQSNAFANPMESPYVPFTNDETTVCGDVDGGTTARAARIVLWVDGQDGADCSDRSTLTLASAALIETDWTQRFPGLPFAHYGQTASITTFPTVTLSDAPALSDEAFESAERCTTTIAASADWQPLCTPALGGAVRHVRIEGVRVLAANRFGHLVVGAPADSTGNPASAPGDRRFILSMGWSHLDTSWTYFRFNGGSSAQFEYATDDAQALYTDAASTVCVDLGAADDHARVLFWASGAGGADCADWSTLSAANALYDSAADTEHGDIWNADFAEGLADFIKLSNLGTGPTPEIAIERVVRFTHAAVL